MEVALPSGGGSKKHVEEWSRLDRLTGILEHARVEADHWAKNTSNSSHHFGKVVDSRARNLADGSTQQKQQTKQLEVFQAQIPGGSVQVIRSHTKTSSSWHSKTQTIPEIKPENKSRTSNVNGFHDHFNDLMNGRNSMDFSSEKSKAQAAKSLGIRRPPTRFRSGSLPNGGDDKIAASESDGSMVKSLFAETRDVCEQAHRQMMSQSFQTDNDSLITNGFRSIGDDSDDLRRLEMKKSSSDENLSSFSPATCAADANVDYEDDTPADSGIVDWKRSSKMRWSLPYPSKSSARRQEEIAAADEEDDCRSNNHRTPIVVESKKITTGKTELQRVMEKVLNKRIEYDDNKTEFSSSSNEKKRRDIDEENVSDQEFLIKPSSLLKKRNSFVTAETLKETISKLRHFGNSNNNNNKSNINNNKETRAIKLCEQQQHTDNDDDGIDTCADDKNTRTAEEEQIVDESGCCTGSLESRTSKCGGGTNGKIKSDEWYNRRKSYGFEGVYSPNYALKSAAANQKIDSSTDSGICRSSSEIVTIPVLKSSCTSSSASSSSREQTPQSAVRHHGGTTVVTLTNSTSNKPPENVVHRGNNKLSSNNVRTLKDANKEAEPEEDRSSKRHSEPIKINVPPPLAMLSATGRTTTAMVVESNLNGEEDDETIIEKHKYWQPNLRPMKLPDDLKPLTSPLTVKSQLLENDHPIGNNANEKKQQQQQAPPKKVGFCKTEVHFAAEPGKINIVETDEKPPPTNLYRKRRNRSETSKQQPLELPRMKFGDYEKNLLLINSNNGNKNNSRQSNNNDHDRCSTSPSIRLSPVAARLAAANGSDGRQSSTTSTTDNGLAVRISSNAAPLDFRRASWSVSENKTALAGGVGGGGYSTKINLGDRGATTVVNDEDDLLKEDDDALKPTTRHRLRHSICGDSSSIWEMTNSSAPEQITRDNVAKDNNNIIQKPIVKQTKTTAVSINIGRGPFRDKHFQPIKTSTMTSSGSLEHSSNNYRRVAPGGVGGNNDKLKSLADVKNCYQYDSNHYYPSSTNRKAEKSINSNNDNNNNNNSGKLSHFNCNKETSSSAVGVNHSGKVMYHNITVLNDAKKSAVTTNNNSISSQDSSAATGKYRATRSQYHNHHQGYDRRKEKVESSAANNKVDSFPSRKKPTTTTTSSSKEQRSRLFESGRDSWLNIPKEQKSTTISSSKSKSKYGGGMLNVKTASAIKNNAIDRKNNEECGGDYPTLEELTKAADEITLAVGGYTDVDSFITSSEDDAKNAAKTNYKHRRSLLETINESKKGCTNLNHAQKKTTLSSSKNSSPMAIITKSCKLTSPRNTIGQNNNNNDDSNEDNKKRTDTSSEDRNKKKQARLLHRACSRELLLQANGAASSSEDVGSEVDKHSPKVKPKFVRKFKPPHTQQTDAVDIKLDSRTKGTIAKEKSTNGKMYASSSASRTVPVSGSNSINKEKSPSVKKLEQSPADVNRIRSHRTSSSDNSRPRISGSSVVGSSRDKLSETTKYKKKSSTITCPDIGRKH